MCKYFSCIVTRDLKVLWDKNTNEHEKLIKDNNLKDDKLENRDFVRLELTMKKGTFFSSKYSDWDYKVDEKGTLPNWYTGQEKKIQKLVWIECQKSFQPFKKNLPACNKFIKSIPKIPYFSMKGKIDLSWNVSYGINWSAAGVAAGAAWDAARDAAWDAAGVAARDAADAAWDAAGDAAWDAADAAGVAADAAGDAALFCRVLLVKGRIERKHYLHAKERMEVWKRGYGLRCDVNGKLFVYGVRR